MQLRQKVLDLHVDLSSLVVHVEITQIFRYVDIYVHTSSLSI